MKVKYQSEEYRNNGIMRDECEWCAAPKEAIRLEVDHAIPYKELVDNFFKIYDKEEFTKGVNKNEKGLYWRYIVKNIENCGVNIMVKIVCFKCCVLHVIKIKLTRKDENNSIGTTRYR